MLTEMSGDAEMSCVFQVDASAASLNSNDAFLLKMADGRGYLWMGKGASEEEKNGAEYMSKELNCSSKHIMEGNEPGTLAGTFSVCCNIGALWSAAHHLSCDLVCVLQLTSGQR